MRSPFMVSSRERVKNHVSTCHGLTWLKTKRCAQWHQGSQHSQSQINISSTLHHLSKSDFRHHLIQPVLFSLPLRDFGFSSLVIVIVKICLIAHFAPCDIIIIGAPRARDLQTYRPADGAKLRFFGKKKAEMREPNLPL